MVSFHFGEQVIFCVKKVIMLNTFNSGRIEKTATKYFDIE